MVIFIGFDSRRPNDYRVCRASLMKHSEAELDIRPLVLGELREQGIYSRIHVYRGSQLWDVISDAPMSTEFAISRFLVPSLMGYEGWAMFCDSDFMFRTDIAELVALQREEYAVMVVKHCYIQRGGYKMDHQLQTTYERKNWSSLMLFNCAHPSIRVLTPAMVNTWAGRNLHAFKWLADRHIGALPFEWNWLELEPKAVHFTDGTPDIAGHENAAYAPEYRRYLSEVEHAGG